MSTIKELIKEERPIERFLRVGKNVSNEELLAILINQGMKNKSSKDLAINKIDGIGPKKAVTILAAVELGNRVINNKKLELKEKMNDPSIIYEHYKTILENCYQEHFYCIYLDNQKRIIKEKLLFVGTINYSIVHPREIFKEAYTLSATSIICIHNHPSLDITPSKEDKILTQNLKEVGNILGIPIIDHIIIGDGYYSFFENGEL